MLPNRLGFGPRTCSQVNLMKRSVEVHIARWSHEMMPAVTLDGRDGMMEARQRTCCCLDLLSVTFAQRSASSYQRYFETLDMAKSENMNSTLNFRNTCKWSIPPHVRDST